MGWFSRQNSAGEEKRDRLRAGITRVASATLDGPEEFRSEAESVAKELKPADIDLIPDFLHDPPAMPTEFEETYGGLGAWLSVCQFACFEILFNVGEAAMPILRNVAFGEYDWTQGNAIEVLCRLAARGVEREEIISEFRHRMPAMRIEALEYAAGPLLQQAETDSRLDAFIHDLEIPEFAEAIKRVRHAVAA
jgi:hypothetical protein